MRFLALDPVHKWLRIMENLRICVAVDQQTLKTIGKWEGNHSFMDKNLLLNYLLQGTATRKKIVRNTKIFNQTKIN